MINLDKIHSWRFNIKLVLFLLAFTYYCILDSNSQEYTSKKEYCLSEYTLCTSADSDYGSGEFTGMSYLPICYEGSVDKKCVDDVAFDCIYQRKQRHTGVILEDELIKVEHEYFLYAIPIIIFMVLSCIGIVLFQSKVLGISFIRDETAFSSTAADYFMNRFISTCAVISFSLMIVSSQKVNFMMTEICDASSNGDLCFDLNVCGLEIRSIAFPKNWLARDYGIITIVLALLLLVIEMYSFLFPPQHDDMALVESGLRLRQMTIRASINSRPDNQNNEALVYIIQTPRGSRVSRRNTMTSILSPRSMQVLTPERYVQQHQLFKNSNASSFRKWKFNVLLSSIAEGSECAICLEKFACSENITKGSGQVVNGSAKVHPVEEEQVEEDSEVDETDFKSAMKSIVQIPCGHVFHEICVFEWVRKNSTCPVCRANTITGVVSS